MHPYTNSIIEQAIAWHIQLQDGEATAKDWTQFESWKQASSEHASAYAHVSNIWDKLGNASPAHARTSIEFALKETSNEDFLKPKRKLAKHTTLPITLLLCGLVYTLLKPTHLYTQDYETAIGEQRTITLPDNSQLILNTNTVLSVDFTDQQRNIKLSQGDVYITVAKDKERPFVVSTAEATATALGTIYQVRKQKNATHVTVIESQVKACTQAPFWQLSLSQCVTLSPNQSTTLVQGSKPQVLLADARTASTWITGMIEMDNTPLVNVLQELQSFSHATIHYNANELAHLHTSGTLKLSEPMKSLALLEKKLPIIVQQQNTADNTISIRLAHP